MSAEELQEEEREALISIYEGDETFKQIDSVTYQYKASYHNSFFDVLQIYYFYL